MNIVERSIRQSLPMNDHSVGQAYGRGVDEVWDELQRPG